MKSILAILLAGIYIACSGSTSTVSPNLTAEYDNRQKIVLLKWQNSDTDISSFVLQRSGDNNKWIDIYSIGSANFSKKKLEKFADKNPSSTKNYYRLKMISGNSDIQYSPSIMVIIGNPLNSWLMFPVPVRDVLNLQYNGSEVIQGVISVFIRNMSGYTHIRRRFSSLSRSIQIPVDNLGRGTYDVSILVNEELIWNQRFVK